MTKNYQPALRQDLAELGFELIEESDHFVHLFFKGLRVATFGQNASLDEIHKAADKFWQEMM